MLNLGEILLVIGSGMVKFLFAPWIAYMLEGKFGGAVLWSFVGGCLGTLVFYRISAWLMERARLRAVRKQLESGIRAKVFTRFNKFVVRMKRGHGLLGIVAVLPFISIPVGSVLAAKYFKHDRRTIPVLIGSVAVWSVLLSVFWRIGQ
jgi:hypothetical protein